MDAQPKTGGAAQSKRRAAMLEAISTADWASIRAQARRHAPSSADAEDAIQQGCVQFLRFYDEPPEVATRWLSVVVKRCAWAIGRRSRARESLTHVVTTVEFGDASDSVVVAADEAAGPLELAERAEALERRIELFSELKPDERTALILLGLGATYREIGELREWSQTKVNRCISEGRAALRRRLAEEEGG